MQIKKRKIEVPTKDTMLFICNSIFHLDYKATMPKSKIVAKMLDAYKTKVDLRKLIEVLSFDAYKKLEAIYNTHKKNGDVIDSFLTNFSDELYDVMLITFEEVIYENDEKEFIYNYDRELFDKLDVLFDDLGKELANNEYTFERVIKGLLNTYGIMKKEYFVTFVNDYLDSNYTFDELLDRIYSKLVLNPFVDRFTINWKNIGESDEFVSKIPYSEKLGNVAESQKQLSFDYNFHEIDYILDNYYIDYGKKYSKEIDDIKRLNNSLDKDVIINFIKEVVEGIKSADEIIRPILEGVDEENMDELINYLTNLHNSLELYPLCGYSPYTLDENKMIS